MLNIFKVTNKTKRRSFGALFVKFEKIDLDIEDIAMLIYVPLLLKLRKICVFFWCFLTHPIHVQKYQQICYQQKY